MKQKAFVYITPQQQVKALVLPLMLLWDQYSGLAWILQLSSCNEMWKHGDTVEKIMKQMRDGSVCVGGGG